MNIISVASALCYILAARWLFLHIRHVHKVTIGAKASLSDTDSTLNDIRLAYGFCSACLIIGIWMLLYPYRGDLASAIAYCATTCAATYLALHRRKLAHRLETWWERFAFSKRISPTQLMLVCVAFCAMSGLELTWNGDFPLVAPHALFIEFVLVLLLVEFAWSLGAGSSIGPSLVLVICCVAGVMQAFVLDFRKTVISFGDIYAFGTAMAVRTGYVYRLNAPILSGITMGFIGIVCCMVIAGLRLEHPERVALLHVRLARCVLAVVLGACVFLPQYQKQLGIHIDYRAEQQLADHKHYLFIPSLIAEAQDLPITRPAGYSRLAADAAQDELVNLAETAQMTSVEAQDQFATLQPSIIIVMNETFSDLSSLGDLDGYRGPTFFSEGLSDAISRGKLAVSVNGGGTCNTEFEMLTGQSMAFVGSNKYPYTMYDLSRTPSLARQFREMGYTTIAMHPNLASNWKRDEVYTDLGFDTFLSIDDFEAYVDDEQYQFHNTISDAATYDMILQQLESSDKPQLIFDVTMQNHGGYDQGGIPDYVLSRYMNYGTTLLDEETQAQLMEYLACIGESDRALQRFIGNLRNLDRPVVLIFFGDHQPSLSSTLAEALYGANQSIGQTEQLYQSDYLVWANYDIAGLTSQEDAYSTQEYDVSASSLSAYALSLVGAPLTTQQRAQLGAQTLLSQLNLFGYRDTDGIWHELDEARTSNSDAARALRDLRYISYRDFGSRI